MKAENRKPQQGKDSVTVVVTGGAGFIGSHTCKVLAEKGFTPVAYDNLCYGHESAVKWGPLECGDIADTERLSSVFRHYQPEAVIHFAAFAYVGESVDDPGKYYYNNVAGTLNLLNAMRSSGIDKIIFSSTCATYGIPEHTPISESHPQAPINPYGRSKLMIEWILEDYYKAYGIKYVVLRYFNAAGADPEAEIGENHHPETHLIPLVLDVAMGRREKLHVFGSDYATSDGTCVRDYIHVSDLADAHLLSLKHLQADGRSKVYNLGNGSGYSVKEVIAAATRVTGREIPWQADSKRPGDPPVLVGSSDRIIADLGWMPKFQEIESIIATAWKWHQSLTKRKV
jgi:UDP-arabinose 4-epimerase